MRRPRASLTPQGATLSPLRRRVIGQSVAYKDAASERSSVSCRRTMVGVGMGALLALAALFDIARGEALSTINAIAYSKTSTPDQRTIVEGEPTELILINAVRVVIRWNHAI